MSDALSYPRMELTVGDITQLKVEAIVNAANSSLLGGGGVDGAIHRAAGPRLLAHNRTLGGCPTGEARITPAFDLEARGVKHIIHTVGPVWGTDPRADGRERLGYRLEDNQLGQCYQACLELAAAHGARTLAFPGISTGVYGFPKERAAQIAVGHVRAFLGRSPVPETVVFCCFSEEDAEIYRRFLTPKDYSQSIQIGRKPS
ncbi:MAG: macro domain-containing protein [Deltaproteobacteria bacterium]|nr:macro domain-containing protein [Deltaproteobacteria bacterium]